MVTGDNSAPSAREVLTIGTTNETESCRSSCLGVELAVLAIDLSFAAQQLAQNRIRTLQLSVVISSPAP
jgi:hypothetical protein